MDRSNNKNRSRPRSRKRILLIVAAIILGLVLAALLVSIIGVNVILSGLQRPEEQVPTMSREELENFLQEEMDVPADFSGPVLDAQDVTLPQAEVVVEDDDNVFSIMLLGVDNFSKQYRSRTDSMILCTVNRSAKTLTMTSFMRDTYVYIPEFYNQRLNVAYPVGGFETLYDTLEYNFGIRVDKGVAVNFTSFKEVIDAIGGVDIELTGTEAGHMNAVHGWWLQKGMNHLTGEQALIYSRIRSIDSDYNRTNRQRKVMSAIIEKAKTLSVMELYRMVSVLIPMVTTDMTNEEILDAALRLAPILKDLKVITQRIPVDDGHTMTMIDGMSVLVPDLEVNSKYLADTLGSGEKADE